MFKKNASHQDYKLRVIELEDIIDSITDGFFSLDNDWKFSHANKAFSLMCGYEYGEFIGKDYWEQFPKAKTQQFYTEYSIAKERKEVRHFEEYSTSLKKWVSVNVYPTDEGLNIFFTDVTEQHDMRVAIANNEMNIRALINNTHDFIWSLDKDLKLIFANKQFEDAMSNDDGKVIVKGDDVLAFEKNTDTRALWKSKYERALAGEAFKVLEESESTQQVFETVLNPIFNDEKAITGVSCFSRDITERLRRIEQIENHNKSLEEIAWLYSHKVRKHVATILGLISIIDDNSDSHKQILEGVASSAKDLDTVIQEINTKSKAEIKKGK